jgi:PilZ domain-containing protein
MTEQSWQGVEIDNAIREFVERRRKKRVQVGVSIRVKGADIYGNLIDETTESINFSAGGTCFFLKKRIRVGMTVALGIVLPPDLKTYHTTGIITRVEADQAQPRFKYGIRFVHNRNRKTTPSRKKG